MFGLKNRSLKTKLILIVLFVTFFALAISTNAIIFINIKDFRNEMAKNLRVLAEAISLNSTAPMVFHDAKKASKVLLSLKADSQIDSAAIFTQKGEIFATFTSDSAKGFTLPDTVIPGQSFNTTYLEIIEPIYFQNELIGMIYLKAHTRELDARINKFLFFVILIIIATLLVAYWFASNLQQIISGPLLYLADMTRKVSHAPDYSIRVKHTSSDELGTLFSGFNVMLEELEKREIELEKYQSHLKDKIVECQISEGKTRTILDNAFDAIIGIDRNGVVLSWNKQAENLFGWESNETSGKYLAELIIPPQHRKTLKKGLDQYLISSGEKAIYKELEIYACHRTGKEFPIEVAITTMGNDSSFSFIVTIRDISERKMAEERLLATQDQLRNLSNKLQSAREEEKARIAREIHDELGQALTGLKLDLSWVKDNLHQEKDLLVNKLDEVNDFIEDTVVAVQRISSDLRPRILDILGLTEALEWQTREFEKRTEILCDLTIIPESIIIDPERSITIFRIYQEALTNVARHANATQIKSFLVIHNDKITLEISDNGNGICEKDIDQSNSLGLVGIRERALAWKGKTLIDSETGKGTTIYVTIPLDES
jgi:PAS domain S-box-containing protein